MPQQQTYARYQSIRGVMFALLGANAAVFGTWQYAINKKDSKLLRVLNENFLLSEANIKAGRYYTLVTNAFSHIAIGHFAFNMV
jgi:membrane associated rhomboid family serine protease